MKLEGIRAVSFDADGTLWDFRKVMRSGLELVVAAIRERFDAAVEPPGVDRLIAIRDALALALRSRGASHEDVRRESFREVLRELGHPDDAFARELTELYLAHRYSKIELFPDVLPALARLERGFRLGVVSNGNSYPDACGLGGWFDFEIFASRCGSEKPHRAIFDAAARATGCRAEEILHVGDALAEDALGAIVAGQGAAWLNRGGVGDRLPGDVLEIRSLAELPPLLGL